VEIVIDREVWFDLETDISNTLQHDLLFAAGEGVFPESFYNYVISAKLAFSTFSKFNIIRSK